MQVCKLSFASLFALHRVSYALQSHAVDRIPRRSHQVHHHLADRNTHIDAQICSKAQPHPAPRISKSEAMAHGVEHGRLPMLLLMALLSLAPAALAFGPFTPPLGGSVVGGDRPAAAFSVLPMTTTALGAIKGVETFGGDFTLSPEVIN